MITQKGSKGAGWSVVVGARTLPVLLIRAVSLVAISWFLVPATLAEESKGSSMHVTLPQVVGGWTLSGPEKRIDPKAIFDYMDGAGELYLGYRFDHLEVHEYLNPKESEILVELYWMDTSDDAFGLLSGDWGGEAVDLNSAPGLVPTAQVRALYGAGLLRIWSGALYARVMTYGETDASRQAVLAIGRAIVSGRPQPMGPRLVQALPQAVETQFALRTDRTVFLRSHLVLNSVYFLSSENLLNLGLNCELASGVYRDSKAGPAKDVRVVLIRYPNETAARGALAHFQRIYLPGRSSPLEEHGVVPVEDGWVGFVLSKRGLGLVFESPDESSTRLFVASSKQALDNLKDVHER